MKILHGMTEIAGQGINTVHGLRNNGYDAVMAVRQPNLWIKEFDIDLGLYGKTKLGMAKDTVKMATFAFKALRKYDVFHCHFAYTLLPRSLDAYLYKLFGLKVFAEFHGTDIRFIYDPNVEYPYYKANVPDEALRIKKQKKLNRLLKHVDGIIIHDYELIPHIPDIGKPLYIVPLRVDIDGITPCYPSTEKGRVPVIVHAPSNRGKKGTEGILKLLDTIEDDFELVLVENKSHDEAMEIYEKADIIIDQVAIGTYGVFSIEAMALGKPVVTYVSPESIEKLPDELPIVNADFDTMAGELKRLIRDPELRAEIGRKGRKYVERYHNNTAVAKQLYEIYNGTNRSNDLFKTL